MQTSEGLFVFSFGCGEHTAIGTSLPDGNSRPGNFNRALITVGTENVGAAESVEICGPPQTGPRTGRVGPRTAL